MSSFRLTLCLAGESVAVVTVPEGETPVLPALPAPPIGFSSWLAPGAYAPLEGDLSCELTPVCLDPKQVDAALGAPLAAFVQSGDINGGDVMGKMSALLYLLLELAESPDPAGASRPILDRVIAHLRYLVSEEDVAPVFDLGPFWAYTVLTAAVALAKRMPAVWGALSARETGAYDLVMRCFAYILNFGNNDANAYTSGPSMNGNFGKGWNPNYRLANVTPMIFAASYFGSAEELDRILVSFDFDEMCRGLKEYGFLRALELFTREPAKLPDGGVGPTAKKVMEEGGPLYLRARDDAAARRLHITEGKPAGDGKGVRVPFLYLGHPLSDVAGILSELFRFNYSGGVAVNTYGEYPDGKPKSYILDGTSSPVVGQMGMMREFASGDGGNGTSGPDIRSSASYCTHDFVMVVGSLAAAKALGIFDLRAPENAELASLVQVGNDDYLHKMEHGYMSYSLAHAYESHENHHAGYYLWKSYWRAGKI